MDRTAIKNTPEKAGEKVKVAGWVHSRRDHGKITFIDLRDETGLVQVVFGDDFADTTTVEDIRPEWVVAIEGTVSKRPKNMVNEDIATGTVELQAENIEVLNEAKTPPFEIDGDGYEIGEEVRLKHRYIDLRRKRLQKNIRLRSTFIQKMREFLFNKDFTEIETPYLTKATPEGSRDFVVPSRHHPGTFFALPQAPQQYKQLLMAGGFERYFQIARAFRDEDLRADRGYEHTQIDLEMAFVQQEDVITLAEQAITQTVEDMGYTVQQKPFPRLSYKEAQKNHGTDSPDLRKDPQSNTLAFAWVTTFPFFEKTKEGRWTFTHNPFSAPTPKDESSLLAEKDIENITAQQYDLVLNGAEIGGGSIRAHRPAVLQAVLEVMGYSKEKIHKQFGHMLEALASGVPPHGGIALGVDRIIMALTGEEALREVQAFPQTSSGKTAVMNAPAELDKKQLEELGIRVMAEDD